MGRMAVTEISSIKSQMNSRSVTVALTSAVLEWFLIFFLFIDAIFSYLVTKFAHYCELQTPCLLCSRLDHVLGSKKLGFYWDLICRSHKLEISSLVFCHVHNKLVDVHEMCESCLFSFATINKSNAETYRLLVGKLGADEDPLFEHPNVDSLGKSHCSCCNELYIPRGSAQNLLENKSVEPEAASVDLPLLGAVSCNCGGQKKRRDKSPGSVQASRSGNKAVDPLSHVGYTELKINSDTESDVLFSDDDDTAALALKTGDPKEKFPIKCEDKEPPMIILNDDLISKSSIHLPSEAEPSLLVSEALPVTIEHNAGVPLASTAAIEHGLEELIWQQAENKPEPISLDATPPSANVTETPPEVLRESNISGSTEPKQISVTETSEFCKTAGGPRRAAVAAVETNHSVSDSGSLLHNNLELGDAYKLAVGNRGRQLSGLLAEQWSGKDSARVNEDLKFLLSQISATRGIELPLNDVSPRVSVNGDELKISDASGPIGLHIFQKRISLERNESGFESLDGSIVSEIDGESVVDRLKRQIEHDKKSLSAMYKELEEERNASAVAANQAMAMITRLQEEKAALHMEALQYLRMMEEQSEYDMEALQKSNDLLAEKEKYLQDLEEELEFYRRKFPDEQVLDNTMDSVLDLKAGEMRREQFDAGCTGNIGSLPSTSVTEKPVSCDELEESYMLFEAKNIGSDKNLLSEFEDDKLYILQCLKALEKKLHLLSNDEMYLDLANGKYSEKGRDEINDLKEVNSKEGSEKLSKAEENRRSLNAQEGHAPLFPTTQLVSKETSEFGYGGQGDSLIFRLPDLVTLGNEVSDLNGRLEALEVDKNFLQHTIKSLKNGDEGLQFIQEIACHLRELRNVGTRRRDQPVS